MGSTTTTTTMAPPPAPRQRAIKPALFPSSLKASTSATGQTSSAAAPRKSGRRTTATARAGGSIAVASRGSSSGSSASTKPAPRPPSKGRVFPAPDPFLCGPIYVPWESAEPPALCCGTRELLAQVVAAQASQGQGGRVVQAAAPSPLAPKPIAAGHSFPPLLSPSSSSTSSSHRQPSPIPHEPPTHPDFLSSLTHLAYPSPVSSTPTPPASSSAEHDFSISAPTPLTLSDYPSQEPVLSFEEEMLAGPFDLSTFSRPGSPISFTELKQEEDLAVLSEVKQEEESSFWTVGRESASNWAW